MRRSSRATPMPQQCERCATARGRSRGCERARPVRRRCRHGTRRLWLAAAALQRALGRTGLRVQAVELESRLAQVDVYAAVPSLGAMHRLLGLDERLVLEVCRGVPMVGQRFSNWAKGAPPFLLAYDDEPPPGGDLPFIAILGEGRARGTARRARGFLARKRVRAPQRRSRPGREPRPLSASYGYHLDAPPTRSWRSSWRCGSASRSRRRARVATSTSTATGSTASISPTGRRVDRRSLRRCFGPRGAADRQAGERRVRILERMAAVRPAARRERAAPARSLPAFSQISAFRGGWVGLFPLQDRTRGRRGL